jgi:hypothetical protein
MEAMYSSENWAGLQRVTGRYIPADKTLQRGALISCGTITNFFAFFTK